MIAAVLFLKVSNCLWEGGRLEGDLAGHLTDHGEQGYGFALRGARNIVIRNVECSNFWGDGINLQYGGSGAHNENVLIENVVCKGNRRQGISIEDGVNISVTNSTFTDTGQKRGTSPKKGIDIEPSYDQAVIAGVTISDCNFSNNAGGGVGCCFLRPHDSDIVVRNCVDSDGGLQFNDCRLDSGNKGIEVVNYQCPAGKMRFARTVNNVRVSSSSFMSAMTENTSDVMTNISFEGLKLRTSEKRTWNFYCAAFVCAKMENVTFNNCEFEILEGSTLSAVLPSGGDWTGASITNSVIKDHRKIQMFIPCDISNSRIECDNGIAFVCSKKTSPLKFDNNVVTIRNTFEGSPFVFYSSSNPDYVISGNTIQSPGRVNTSNLIKRYRTNSVDPKVVFRTNSFVRR